MKKMFALLLALTLTLALSACGTKTNEPADKEADSQTSDSQTSNPPSADSTSDKVFKVGVCTRAFSSPWQTYCYEVMEQEVKEKYPDIELDFQDGNEDANTQVNILQTFIQQKKDLVIVFANQEGTLVSAVNQVIEAGIPVILSLIHI